MRYVAMMVLFALVAVCEAAPVRLSDAQIRETRDGSQLVFDLTGPVRHSVFMLANPPRLVLDLDNTRLVTKRNLNLRSAEVQSVRAGIRDGVDLRIVADLEQPFAYESELRSAPGTGRRQLVLDIVRGKGAAAKQRTVSYGAIPTVSARRNIVIAIDAGHGGKDPGAIGPKGTREKVVALQIARRLRDLVNSVPGMRGVLTRDRDIYLPLRKRIQIARSHQADMFISIHADAYTNPKARGSSVFMLSTRGASSTAARWLADKENAADLIGGISLTDKNDEVASVLLDLSQDATLEASMHLASKVLGQLSKIGNVHKVHVERAGFVVLKSPDIPSILVETAFITNPDEEAKLRSAHHQQSLAQAILDGIRDYYRRRLPRYLMMAEAPPTAEPAPAPVAKAEVIEREAVAPPPKQVAKVTETATPVRSATAAPKRSIPVPPTNTVLPELVLVSKPTPARSEFPAPPVKVAPVPVRQSHVIRRGESLFEIATRYHISVTSLRTANGLNSNQLRLPAGTMLTIPVGES